MRKLNARIVRYFCVVIFIFSLVIVNNIDAKGKYSINKMTVSGGTIGGTSNLMANGLAAIGYKYCTIQGTVTTNATMTQVKVLEAGEAEISTVVGYQAYDAYHGKNKWKGKPYSDLRTLFQGNRTTWHFAVLDASPIQSVKDLKGKKVVTGKRGFFADDFTKKVTGSLGIVYGRDYKPIYLGHADAMAALINGTVDAYVVMADAPQPTFVQLTESHHCRIIGLTPEEMSVVQKEHPYVLTLTIKVGTYKGMKNDVLAPVSWMLYGCKTDLPEDVAYGLTKAFWEHQDFAAMQWAALGEYEIEDIPLFVTAPYHVGALRYFKERGLKIPTVMVPPGSK